MLWLLCPSNVVHCCEIQHGVNLLTILLGLIMYVCKIRPLGQEQQPKLFLFYYCCIINSGSELMIELCVLLLHLFVSFKSTSVLRPGIDNFVVRWVSVLACNYMSLSRTTKNISP